MPSLKQKTLKITSDCFTPSRAHQKKHLSSLATQYNQAQSPTLKTQSPINICERISQIRPFAVHEEFHDLQNRLNEVYTMHKSPKQNRQNKFIFHHRKPPKRKCYSHILQNQCKDIISKKTQSHFRKTSPSLPVELQQSIRSKTVQQSYDDLQCEIANQLITESRKDSKVFRATLKKIHNMIENAEVQYVRREAVNLNPEEVKKYGGFIKLAQKDNVCQPYSDPLPQSQRPSHKRTRTDLYDLNKNDYYTWLKSSNRFINIQRVKVEVNQANKLQRQASYCSERNSKGSELIYRRYFKNNAARRNILRGSAQIIK